jgi:Uma2 family endonuclease
MSREDTSLGVAELANGVPHPDRRMTEEEFVAWCDEDTRAEWVDGEVVLMSPATAERADLNGWLNIVFRLYVEKRDLGVVLGPEFQVRLGPQRRRRVPDLLFVAKGREEIIRPNHVEGAPDVVMEIVSPDSVARDWRVKYLEYEAAGVREYWVLDPGSQQLEASVLAEDRTCRPL